MPCANTQKARHFALKHGLNSPETDYFQIKIKKTLIKFCRKEKLPYLCTRLQQVRALSSAGLEHLPYKQRVGGSNPSAPTRGSGVRIPQRPLKEAPQHFNVVGLLVYRQNHKERADNTIRLDGNNEIIYRQQSTSPCLPVYFQIVYYANFLDRASTCPLFTNKKAIAHRAMAFPSGR